MQNRVDISLGETIKETMVSINGEPLKGLIDINLHSNANDMMPVLHLVMYAPNDKMSEDLKQSLLNDIDILKSIPYVELKFQELK